MHTPKPKKVLVIRFSSIGDIVLCSPVLRCLKKIPGQNIQTHLLTKKSFAAFAGNYPYVDKVFALEKSLSDVIALLKKENYDFIIDLHNNLRSLRVKLALRAPSRSFNKLNIEKWLLTNLGIDRMPDLHIVDRYLDAAKPLGVTNDHAGLDFFIPDRDQVAPKELPPDFQQGYIGFVIGGTYATKRLPLEKITEICRQLEEPVVLLGGPEDRETGDRIAENAGTMTFNACGKFSLNASASLVQQADAIISHDTGLMHIAAAFHKPIASIWGNTVPQLGMYPYMPAKDASVDHTMFEVKNLKCRPCSKIGYNKCPKKHFKCMQDIPVESIVSWVKKVKNVKV